MKLNYFSIILYFFSTLVFPLADAITVQEIMHNDSLRIEDDVNFKVIWWSQDPILSFSNGTKVHIINNSNGTTTYRVSTHNTGSWIKLPDGTIPMRIDSNTILGEDPSFPMNFFSIPVAQTYKNILGHDVKFDIPFMILSPSFFDDIDVFGSVFLFADGGRLIYENKQIRATIFISPRGKIIEIEPDDIITGYRKGMIKTIKYSSWDNIFPNEDYLQNLKEKLLRISGTIINGRSPQTVSIDFSLSYPPKEKEIRNLEQIIKNNEHEEVVEEAIITLVTIWLKSKEEKVNGPFLSILPTKASIYAKETLISLVRSKNDLPRLWEILSFITFPPDYRETLIKFFKEAAGTGDHPGATKKVALFYHETFKNIDSAIAMGQYHISLIKILKYYPELLPEYLEIMFENTHKNENDVYGGFTSEQIGFLGQLFRGRGLYGMSEFLANPKARLAIKTKARKIQYYLDLNQSARDWVNEPEKVADIFEQIPDRNRLSKLPSNTLCLNLF
ncbi:MAG: hypothetical protein ABIA04_16005 [Pseudomonadota bacterium]